MKKTIMLIGFLTQLFSGKAQYRLYADYSVYTGSDLGLTYSPKQSAFRIWSPTADKAELIIYAEGISGTALQHITMTKSEGGT